MVVVFGRQPENILLDELGHCKLVDFGFTVKPDESGVMRTVVGTPAYLSPEQLNAKFTNGYTRIVDWWSFGCITCVTLRYTPSHPVTPRLHADRRLVELRMHHVRAESVGALCAALDRYSRRGDGTAESFFRRRHALCHHTVITVIDLDAVWRCVGMRLSWAPSQGRAHGGPLTPL